MQTQYRYRKNKNSDVDGAHTKTYSASVLARSANIFSRLFFIPKPGNHRPARIRHPALFPVLLLQVLAVVLVGCGAERPEPLHYTGNTMGTYYSVQVVQTSDADIRDQNVKWLGENLEGILIEINRLMSTYQVDSELSRFNATSRTDWIPVSTALYTVVKEALHISQLTEGAFDITVGPLVNLWGFGPPTSGTGDEKSTSQLPSNADLAATLARTGYRKLAIRATPPALRKDHPALYLDLSAIAKGFAVDQIAEHLEERGFDNYLVDIGGELRGKGKNSAGQPWRVGIEKPTPGQRAVHQVIAVDNHAVATSGDYRNFFEQDGKRYSHTIDPKTGRPVTHNLVSVTVLTPKAMRADALATAISVLGPEAGYQLAKREGIPIWLISKTESASGEVEFTDRSTSEFEKFLMTPH